MLCGLPVYNCRYKYIAGFSVDVSLAMHGHKISTQMYRPESMQWAVFRLTLICTRGYIQTEI